MARAKKAAAKKSARAKGKITEFKGTKFAADAGNVYFVMDLGRDILVVRTNEYKKRTSLDIRRFYDNGSAVWLPGRGVSVPKDKAEKFLNEFERVLPAICSDLDVG